MRTIAICNLKGGVAKTTTVVNLAANLAHDHERKVLVIDGDSQANSTAFLKTQQEYSRTLGTLLRVPENSRTDFTLAVEQACCFGASTVRGVDLLPADDSLMDLDLSQVADGKAWVGVLREMLRAKENQTRWDFVLIDCPPAFNAASAAALLAADEVIIPVRLDAFSLGGMANMTRQISNMRKINPKLRLLGVLPTMFYKSERNRDALRQLREAGFPLLPSIRRSDRVDEMTWRFEPLYQCSPRSGACLDYRCLADKIAGGEK